MNNSVNKCCCSFTSNSTAEGKSILFRKETKTSFDLSCLGGSFAAEVQIIYNLDKLKILSCKALSFSFI